MAELIERLLDEVRSAWRFRWTALVVALVIALLGWAAIFAIPDRYEASASIFVDTRTPLQPVLEGLTGEQDVTGELAYVRQSLLTGMSLLNIARTSGIVPESVTDPREVSATLDQFAEALELEVTTAGSSPRDAAGTIYSFSYEDTDRDRALKVVQTVVDSFASEFSGGKRRTSELQIRFAEQQLEEMATKLRATEERLAEFKRTNMGLMPTDDGDYFAQLQRENEQVQEIQAELDTALARRNEYARQLRGEVIFSPAVPSAGGGSGAASDTLSKLREAEARRAELLLKYTDKHYEVVALGHTIEELRRRREQELESLRRGDAEAVASSGLSTNPVYQSIQLQLNQADAEVASLRSRLDMHRSRAADLQRRMDVAPKVAVEYAEIMRTYESDRRQYETMLANLERARLGEEADTVGAIKFETVKPVSAPFSPVFPPRVLLMTAVLLFALLAGAAVSWLRHALNPVVTSARSLSRLIDVPVIGVVSAAFPERLAAETRGQVWRVVGAMAGLVGLFVGAVILSQSGFRLAAAAGG